MAVLLQTDMFLFFSGLIAEGEFDEENGHKRLMEATKLFLGTRLTREQQHDLFELLWERTRPPIKGGVH